MIRVFACFPFLCFANSLAQKELDRMSLEEKVGQLFVAPCAPLRGEDHWMDWKRLIEDNHIGNALMKASDPLSQIRMVEKLKKISAIRPLIVADAEWGLGMRMIETISFPRNLTLGAIEDLSFLEKMGESIGRQARRVGIDLNLAPVADVNSNPNNPVIHMRSFGEDAEKTSKKVAALIRGMRREGLLTCAKHFPGHGDTQFDSHQELPVIEHSLGRLKEVELKPFCAAIEAKVDCIMSGHLLFPALDHLPVSLSKRCMKELLCDEMGFQGLLITDALNMSALTTERSVEEIALRAFDAGHHFLLYGAHLDEKVDALVRDEIPRAHKALVDAFLSGRLDQKELDERVLAILKMKEKREDAALVQETFQERDSVLKKELYRKALTQLGAIPKEIFGYVAIHGQEEDWIVGKMRKAGIPVICYDPKTKIDLSFAIGWAVGVHRVGPKKEGFHLQGQSKRLIEQSPLTLYFCTPYAIESLDLPALVAYELDKDAQEAAWDAMQGSFVPTGELPIRVDRKS